jgi:hypothetical protein
MSAKLGLSCWGKNTADVERENSAEQDIWLEMEEMLKDRDCLEKKFRMIG